MTRSFHTSHPKHSTRLWGTVHRQRASRNPWSLIGLRKQSWWPYWPWGNSTTWLISCCLIGSFDVRRAFARCCFTMTLTLESLDFVFMRWTGCWSSLLTVTPSIMGCVHYFWGLIIIDVPLACGGLGWYDRRGDAVVRLGWLVMIRLWCDTTPLTRSMNNDPVGVKVI